MESYLKLMEEVPTQTYLRAALVAVGLSALLRPFGKKDAAVFVGQWPSTLILLALAYKLLRPGDDDAAEDGYQAAEPATRLITATSQSLRPTDSVQGRRPRPAASPTRLVIPSDYYR
jgi:hypothetical protein